MARPEHGWKNDETWIVASQIENDVHLHEIMVNEASFALTKAIGSGRKTKRDIVNFAISEMISIMRHRLQTMDIRLSDVVRRSRMKKAARADANILMALVRHAIITRVNWREIARHYVSAFME
jgi:hypothetical protein